MTYLKVIRVCARMALLNVKFQDVVVSIFVPVYGWITHNQRLPR
jgi:hypothetical protein